jgi:hypothetical protein
LPNFMISWVSHMPSAGTGRSAVGSAMKEVELKLKPRLEADVI